MSTLCWAWPEGFCANLELLFILELVIFIDWSDNNKKEKNIEKKGQKYLFLWNNKTLKSSFFQNKGLKSFNHKMMINLMELWKLIKKLNNKWKEILKTIKIGGSLRCHLVSIISDTYVSSTFLWLSNEIIPQSS